MILKGHTISPGYAEGEAIVTKTAFSFLGELDPSTGKVPSLSHDLFDQTIAGKILVFPTGKGSSAAPIVSWLAAKRGNNPKAMVCVQSEPIVAAAAITVNIPMIDKLDQNPLDVIKTGDYLKVDATKGILEIVGK